MCLPEPFFDNPTRLNGLKTSERLATSSPNVLQIRHTDTSKHFSGKSQTTAFKKRRSQAQTYKLTDNVYVIASIAYAEIQ